MPILWRYQIKHFCIKLFFILILSVASMLTFKVNEVSKLLSLGISAKNLIFFIFLQIPILLPMVLAISGFIAAYLVIQQLSEMGIFSSLRASGLSLNTILSPLFFMGLVLSILNFYLVMEILPLSRIRSYSLSQDVSQMNPLVILKKGKVLFLKDAFIHMDLDDSHSLASNVFILFQNPYTKYLNLFKADSLYHENDSSVEIKSSSLISTIQQENGFLPTILLENVNSQSIPLSFFTDSFSNYKADPNKRSKKISDVLTMRELITIFKTPYDGYLLSELFLRVAIGILPFVLVFMSAILSVPSLERKPLFNTLLLIFSFLFCITAVLLAKSLRKTPTLSIPLTIIPYTVSMFIAIRYRHFLEKAKRSCS